MDRIAAVQLFGFKGLDRAYQLEGPTILSGANGSGKSACLEGLIYALTGAVPGGRKLDAVAALFPPRGGSVRVTDSAGRWIERGIVRDAGKAKVSEVLRTSDDKEGEDPNLSAWAVSDVVLDVQEFLMLSTEKRREFVLRLCGGGVAPGDLGEKLALEYAREVAGKGATADWLDGADDAMAMAWRRPRGLREVLASLLSPGSSNLSELFLKLSEVSKERRLGARAAALEAGAAIKELEAEAKGARAAAEALEAKRAAVAKLQEEASVYRVRLARRDEARSRRDAATKTHQATLARLEEAEKLAAAAPAPVGERPLPPTQDPRRADALAKLGSLQGEEESVRKSVREFEKLLEAEKSALEKGTKAGADLLRHEQLPLRRVKNLIAEIPDEADPSIPELRLAICELSRGFDAETAALERRAEDTEEEFIKAVQKAQGAEGGRRKAQERAVELVAAIEAERKKVAEISAASEDGDSGYRRALAAWEATAQAHRAAADRLGNVRAAMDQVRTALVEAEKRCEAIQAVNGEAFPDLLELEGKLDHAEAELETAEAAAGALSAYKAAVARAEQSQVDERAWKAAEAGIRVLREAVVGASTSGLIGELNEVLRAAGRPETAYLELENERGRPCFELGWVRGEVRTPVPALSSGEAVLFLAALSVALTRRSPGRRLLLVEGDPLDVGNLEALLRALAPQAGTLEALVVATAATGWTAPTGWGVEKL